MPQAAKDNILEQDKQWMTWLKACSRRSGTSSMTILQEYANSKKDWYASLELMRTDLLADWVFLRGKLSEPQIASARDRYLSQYVFVAGENCSQSYVDALLAAEDSQIRLRLEHEHAAPCESCRERDREIALLRAALRARKLRDNADIRIAAVKSIFQRYFIMGEHYMMCRTLVRQTIERVMRIEISPEEVLPARCDTWKRFIREILGQNPALPANVPCRARVPPLTMEEFGEVSSKDF